MGHGKGPLFSIDRFGPPMEWSGRPLAIESAGRYNTRRRNFRPRTWQHDQMDCRNHSIDGPIRRGPFLVFVSRRLASCFSCARPIVHLNRPLLQPLPFGRERSMDLASGHIDSSRSPFVKFVDFVVTKLLSRWLLVNKKKTK